MDNSKKTKKKRKKVYPYFRLDVKQKGYENFTKYILANESLADKKIQELATNKGTLVVAWALNKVISENNYTTIKSSKNMDNKSVATTTQEIKESNALFHVITNFKNTHVYKNGSESDFMKGEITPKHKPEMEVTKSTFLHIFNNFLPKFIFGNKDYTKNGIISIEILNENKKPIMVFEVLEDNGAFSLNLISSSENLYTEWWKSAGNVVYGVPSVSEAQKKMNNLVKFVHTIEKAKNVSSKSLFGFSDVDDFKESFNQMFDFVNRLSQADYNMLKLDMLQKYIRIEHNEENQKPLYTLFVVSQLLGEIKL